MNKARVGVFGVGSLGQWHARIYSELEDTELIGVYDINQARASEIAEKYKTRAFNSIDDLASQIDAASIVVPAHKHFEVFSQLVNHNIHILVEKPIAATSEQAEQMVQIARDKNLMLQVGHVERFNPVMAFLEKNLARPRFIEATRLSSFPPLRENAAPRGTEVSVVLDLMIHDLDIIMHLVRSPIKTINATGVAVLSPTEDIANARITFNNGCVANITASRISKEQLRKIRVFQDDTYLSLDYMNQNGQLCKKTPSGIDTIQVPIEKGAPLDAELASFAQCVIHKHNPVVTGQHASNALNLAVEICQCIRNNPS